MDSNKRPESMARITTPELANAFIEEQIAEVRAQVGDKKVLLALSGGVDSSVSISLYNCQNSPEQEQQECPCRLIRL